MTQSHVSRSKATFSILIICTHKKKRGEKSSLVISYLLGWEKDAVKIEKISFEKEVILILDKELCGDAS